MGIFNDLKASDDDVASNEVDKTARATGSEILDSIFNLTREITSDMMSLDDTAENMADKACLTEVLKGNNLIQLHIATKYSLILMKTSKENNVRKFSFVPILSYYFVFVKKSF